MTALVVQTIEGHLYTSYLTIPDPRTIGQQARAIGQQARTIGQQATSIGQQARTIGQQATSIGQVSQNDQGWWRLSNCVKTNFGASM
jgi:hypothetical protein